MRSPSRCLTIILFLLLFLFFYALTNGVRNNNNVDTFTPKIKQTYRPYFRRARIQYDTFINYFTNDNIILKLKKWNIY
jgi:hypothetical protein